MGSETDRPKYRDGQSVLWNGRVVVIANSRLDYPMSAFVKIGSTPSTNLKRGACREWLYQVFGSGREIREDNLKPIG